MALTTNKPSTNISYYSAKGHRWTIFGAGAFAGATMTLAMLILLWTGITSRSLANLIADKIATFFPAQFTESIIQAIGPLGKELVFIGVIIGQIAVGGGLALLMMQLFPRIIGRNMLWRNVIIIATGFWLLIILAVLPLVDVGFLGSKLTDQQVPFLIFSFLLFQLYALALGYFFIYLVPEQSGTQALSESKMAEEEETGISLPSRRRFIMGMTAFFIAAIGAGVGVGLLKGRPTLFADSDITPTDKFYKVSKNAIDPKVSATGWKLEVKGLVDKTLTFDYDSVRQLPAKTQAYTLTCISNTVGGEYIGNAQWKGTPLKGVLEMAGVKPTAKRVVFTSADGYTDSITIEKALEPDTLMAWEQNGEPLADGHGFPLRMLIPDIYGMKNAKWVNTITIVDDADYEGFWQEQGWDNQATIHTQSTIITPSDLSQVKSGAVTTLKGVAFAGARGIQKVEVSTDNGKTWQEAKLRDPLSPFSWVLWSLDWTPSGGAGTRNILKVRATDKTGKLQTTQTEPAFPSGANGLHTISTSTIA